MSKGEKAITLKQALLAASALEGDDLLTVDAAASDAGISPNALKQARWRARHGKASVMETEIVEVIERAVARQCKNLAQKGLDAFAAGQRTGFVEFLLERKAPLEYGRKQIVALTGEEGGPVQTETKLSTLGNDELLSTYIQALKDKDGQ